MLPMIWSIRNSELMISVQLLNLQDSVHWKVTPQKSKLWTEASVSVCITMFSLGGCMLSSVTKIEGYLIAVKFYQWEHTQIIFWNTKGYLTCTWGDVIKHLCEVILDFAARYFVQFVSHKIMITLYMTFHKTQHHGSYVLFMLAVRTKKRILQRQLSFMIRKHMTLNFCFKISCLNWKSHVEVVIACNINSAQSLIQCDNCKEWTCPWNACKPQ